MSGDDNILLGTIAKTYGVRCELIIRTANPSFDLKQDWESIFLQIDGILVPFFISDLRPFKQDEWILKLDWYEDKTRSETLVGYSVWIQDERMETTEDEIYLDELIGFEFTDKNSGKKGLITDFMDIPDNPVFEVAINEEKKLIPASDELILEVDTGKRMITFELPEGII